jgi:hypothetical protein
MNKLLILTAALLLLAGQDCRADSTRARCDVYPAGQDHTDTVLACTFSQRQGYITIAREDGVIHELSPTGEAPGNFTDADGRAVYRQAGLGDQGLIFRFPDESVLVWWNTHALNPESEEDNWTAPFTTSDYDATTRLDCRAAGDTEFGSCPAGVLRMEDGQASVVVQNQLGEQFTINFMKDYVNATNRQLEARLEGDTWILDFENGETWQVPIALIEGG